MKNFKSKLALTLSCALFVFVFTANGQDGSAVKHKYAEFGIRFMPTFSSLKIKSSAGDNLDGEVTLGFGMGAFLGFNFTEHVGVQGEIIYSSITQKTKTKNDLEQKIVLRYVNIPLLLSLNTGKSKMINLNLVLGPQIGFNTSSRLTQTGNNIGTEPQPVLSVRKSDLGFAYGAGVDFGLNAKRNFRLGLGYRGVLGLLDISDKSKSLTTDSYYVLDRTRVNTNAIYAGLSILF